MLEDTCKKGSGLIGLIPAPSVASQSVVSFYWMLLCPGTHIVVTWFTSDNAVSFFKPSATSSDFVPLALKAATATWLSVQIVVRSSTNLFLRQLVTQSSIATTSACCSIPSQWNVSLYFALVFSNSCSSPYWLQAPFVNHTCPFLNWLGQFCPYSSPVGITIQYLLTGRLSVMWSFIILNLLSTLSALRRSDYVLFLGFSDLALVSSMLPSVPQTRPLFWVLADPRASPVLLLELFSLPLWSQCMRSSADIPVWTLPRLCLLCLIMLKLHT